MSPGHAPADCLLLALLPSGASDTVQGAVDWESGNQGLSASSADQVHDLGQVTSLRLSLFPHRSHGNIESI